MKKLLEVPRYERILGVDPSSQKIACCLVEGGRPTATMKLDLQGGDLYARLRKAKLFFPKVLEIYKPQFVCIEQTILVQNVQTTRKLSYVVGVLMAEVLIRDIPLEDVPPMAWKSFLGAKPLTSRWKSRIISELGEDAGKKEITRLKKSQTQDILRERYPEFDNIWRDDDIADAAGIGLYAFENHGKAVVDR